MTLRTQRWIIAALCAFRGAVLATGAPSVIRGYVSDDRHPVALGSFLVFVVWSAFLATIGFAHNGLRARWVVIDAVAITAAEFAFAFSDPAGFGNSASWIWQVAVSATMFTVVYLRRQVAALLVTLVISGSVAEQLRGSTGTTSPNNLWTTMSGAIVFILLGLLVGGLVRGVKTLARTTDEAITVAMAASHREALRQARLDERTQLYRMLHDTVLTTLTLISRGGLDHWTKELQARAARDAEFLRGLITEGEDASPTNFAAALAEVVRDRAALGLQIHYQSHELPGALPRHVVIAVISATREALNNVAKHAGANEAWLTAVGEDSGGIKVTIVDRGRGFDLAKARSGLGITRSIRHRIEEIQGTASVDSTPNEGTVVELTWSP